MKKRPMLSFWGAMLLLSVSPVAAQNSVDVLNNGPQPANTTGCAVNPNCIPATWSTASNAGADITTAIPANFVFDPNGGALPTDFPTATSGQICLADTRDLTGTTVFGQIAANCQAAGGVALLLIRDSAVTGIYPRPTGTFCGILSSSTRRPESPISRFESMWLRLLPPATLPVSTTARMVRRSQRTLGREPRSTPPMRVCACPREQDRLSSPA